MTNSAITVAVVDATRAEPFATVEQYWVAVEQARAASAAYYAGADQTVDDATYDALIARMQATEAAHPDWTPADSPTAVVAAGVAPVGDVVHGAPMLSLDNVFDDDGLRAWTVRLDKLVGTPVTRFVVEPKIDGLAVSAIYVGGVLARIATRGDGRAGEDVTGQARLVAGLPATLAESVSIEVRGEVFMTDADFAVANARRTGAGEPAFANPRSAAAGSLRAVRTYDVPLSFFAYAVPDLEPDVADTHSGALAYLEGLGIATTASSSAGLATCGSIDVVVEAVARLGANRGGLGFGIDGVVIKADLYADQAAAGSGSRAPRWGTAYKFPADTRTAKLIGIEVQVGRTGVITPVAVLEPVQVAGVTITSATLHNFADLVLRDVRVGDTVFVRRAGDVIPEITGAVLDLRPVDAQPFTAPLVCPRCGGEIDRSQKRWRCVQGRACGAGESLAYFVSRDAMDVEGMGDKILDALVAGGHVADPADLYALDVSTLAGLQRMGVVSATKLVAALTASKQRPLSRVLTGLGVRMTGRRLSRRLAQHFGTMTALQAASMDDLLRVEGVGPERATVIAAELVDLAGVIAKLAGHGLAMTEPDVTPPAAVEDGVDGRPLRKPDGVPMTVVVTGSVPGLTRNEGNEAVEELGGKSSGSVSARTDLVVIGEGAGSKADKARELGIPIMPADRFAELLAAHRAGPAGLSQAG